MEKWNLELDKDLNLNVEVWIYDDILFLCCRKVMSMYKSHQITFICLCHDASGENMMLHMCINE